MLSDQSPGLAKNHASQLWRDKMGKHLQLNERNLEKMVLQSKARGLLPIRKFALLHLLITAPKNLFARRLQFLMKARRSASIRQDAPDPSTILTLALVPLVPQYGHVGSETMVHKAPWD